MGEKARAARVSMARTVEKNIPGVWKSSKERKYMLTRAVRPSSKAPSVRNLMANWL